VFQLADFLTPKYFRFSVQFPLTATGKVDKLQLKKTIMEGLNIEERSWQ
jgi:non-ribosomal peptide synthetase component E (peptide arylation enzyme)